jgi:hypothetical protein
VGVRSLSLLGNWHACALARVGPGVEDVSHMHAAAHALAVVLWSTPNKLY